MKEQYEGVETLGVDIAKNVFQVHGVNGRGKVILKRQLTRTKVKEVMANLPSCLVGMEACGGAHYWAREFRKFGHQVKLISPQFVKPYVKSNKNDVIDAEAICEAVSRPHMRFVPIKDVFHQDIQCLHRIRERLVKHRTALSNEIRGLLGEYGIIVSQGISHLKERLPELLEEGTNELTPMARELFHFLYEELNELGQRVSFYEERIMRIFRAHEVCKRLEKVEGVGPLTATALLAAVPEPKEFRNGRQMAAWLGLVPRQHSSGGKTILGGISKRGDRYVRSLLIHGARSVLKSKKRSDSKRDRWIQEKKKTRGFNKAAVALANKNARILWALLAHGEEYRKAA